MNNTYCTAGSHRIHNTLVVSTRPACHRSVPFVLKLVVCLLCGIENAINYLSRPAVKRIAKGTVVLACLIAFLCLISAVEQQTVSVLLGVVASLFLVFVEILCLR